MDTNKIIKGTPAEGKVTPAETAAPGDPKVIKRDSFAAMVDALTILETAREQARAIVRDAEEQRTRILEEARREGEDQGRADYLRGLAQALDAIDGFYARAEPEIVRLAVGIARKVIGEELAVSQDTVLKIVREGLSSGRRARHVEIKVHASDVARVRAGIPRLELASSCEVEVLASAGVEPGGCVIETEFGIIDARLETQLRVIEQSLTRSGRPQ